MIFKNVFNWDCCAFPKLLNTERMTIISSKCNAWSDVLPECGTRDERPLFPPIFSSAPIRGEKPKCPHLSWFGCTGTYGRANQSCCNVLLMQVSQEQLVWWSRHWVLGWPPNSLTNENGELFFFFFLVSTAFIPCEYFCSEGQVQLCSAPSLMLESIISELLGRLTDVCYTNKGFQLGSEGASSFVWWQYVEWLAF